MLKVKVNGKKEHAIAFDKGDSTKGTIDGIGFEWDLVKIKEGSYHVIKDHQSYNVEIISIDALTKTVKLKVNGNKYNLEIKDKYDELLQQLGIDTTASLKVKELKSPMPGLILGIKVSEGDAVKKGDTLLLLEAMKMENVLKSPVDTVIKKINVKQGVAVEKGQVLIQFA